MRMTRGRSEHHDHGHGSADRRGWTGKPALRTRVVTEASDMTTAKYILGGRMTPLSYQCARVVWKDRDTMTGVEG